MDGYYIVSLVKFGVLGGAIVADGEAMTYRTNKVTVPAKYRALEMRYEDMESVGRSGITFSFRMKDGEEYKYLVFAPGKFEKALEKAGVEVRK